MGTWEQLRDLNNPNTVGAVQLNIKGAGNAIYEIAKSSQKPSS